MMSRRERDRSPGQSYSYPRRFSSPLVPRHDFHSSPSPMPLTPARDSGGYPRRSMRSPDSMRFPSREQPRVSKPTLGSLEHETNTLRSDVDLLRHEVIDSDLQLKQAWQRIEELTRDVKWLIQEKRGGADSHSSYSRAPFQSPVAERTHHFSLSPQPLSGRGAEDKGARAPPRKQVCDLCKVMCPGPSQWEDHLRGKKHQGNLQLLQKGPGFERMAATATPKEVTPVPTKTAAIKPALPYHCPACDVRCPSEVVFQGHLRGKKHKDKMLKMQGLKEEGDDGRVVAVATEDEKSAEAIEVSVVKDSETADPCAAHRMCLIVGLSREFPLENVKDLLGFWKTSDGPMFAEMREAESGESHIGAVTYKAKGAALAACRAINAAQLKNTKGQHVFAKTFDTEPQIAEFLTFEDLKYLIDSESKLLSSASTVPSAMGTDL